MVRLLTGVIVALRAVNRAVEWALKPLVALCVTAMLATVVWTVAARLSGISAPWTEKVMLILLPALAFLVAPIAYRRGANVSLDMLVNAMPARLARAHLLGVHVLIGVILLVALDLTLRKVGVAPLYLDPLLAALGIDLTSIRPFRAPIKIPVLGIEWRTVYLIMPASVALMLLANVELIGRYLLGLFDPHDQLVRPVRSFDQAHANVGE
ncbi:MAG: TRAP transporter small permease subunit [Pseudomonadota bacterium]